MSRAKTIKQLLSEKDEVTLVSPDGSTNTRMEKFAAHKHPAQLHLAISVWLYNSKKEVLLQKRSTHKIVGSGWWANTVCGNVWPTETYFDCALRRLKVELGITNVALTPIYQFTYKAYGNDSYGEHELDQVYVGQYDGVVVPNPQEASEYAWVNFEKLQDALAQVAYINEEQSLLLSFEELKKQTAPVLVVVEGKEFLLAPWTVFMLKGAQLRLG